MDSSLEFSNSLSSVSSPVRCRIFKIIVIGDSGVGKTCLTHRFCAGQFLERTDATIGVDFRERIVHIDGERIKLQLWDTAGQERFRKSMVQQYYRNVHAVLFVYDVTSPASFRALDAWVEECRRNSLGQNIPRFLVGNKSDLRGGLGVELDQVSRERAQRFADALGMTLFETSAKNLDHGEIGEGGGEEGGGGGSRLGTQHQQERVEAVLQALAARVVRQRNPPVATGDPGGGVMASFKLPANKGSEKDMWACTC